MARDSHSTRERANPTSPSLSPCPKWGLYRGVDKDMNLGDDYIEHKNASAQKQ
jgi:hypothetical protein